MTAWQDSRSNTRRHVHTPVEDSKGQMICTACSQIVVKPILSSEDPRLQGAGLHRSGGEDFEIPFPLPLPVQLILMDDWGWPEAPIAPYVVMVAQVAQDRGEDVDDLWERLANKS